MKPLFETIHLDDDNTIQSGWIPADLIPDSGLFESVWDLHPEDYHDIKIRGKLVKTPRWQQAYNKTYQYAGSRNIALKVPDVIKPYWDWVKAHIDSRLNGLLLNWYDGKRGHYIGKHRDSTANLIDGAPIVTISYGEERKFRFRPWGESGFKDFVADNGSVFIVPYATNQSWTHEVPASRKLLGRRISLTVRAFE